MSDLVSFTTSAQLETDLAHHIATLLQNDIDTRGVASLAVSGGSTPKGLFDKLSRCDIDWTRVSITLVDERWVDTASPDSNEAMVRQILLNNLAVDAQFVGLKTPHDDAELGLSEVRSNLATISRPFSAVILGMGGDGHTASWFPQASNLADLLNPAGEEEVGTCDPVTAPHQRITLTFPAVLNSGEIILHIVGREKQAVLASAAENELPIAAVLKQTTTPVSIWWAPQ